jgi:hypothetical protein
MNWYQLKPPSNAWLVDGLITSDGHAAICGKPKAGKSTFVRSLICSLIKSIDFIGRSIDIPPGEGRVLYIHLDRKDQPGRVAQELKELGITEQESDRLIFRTAQDMPEQFEERLLWIQEEVRKATPHLVVIDMLWQFVVAKNNNDYNAVIDGINKLQDALLETSYKGALIVTLHGRKAENPDDSFDDILGSTGQRGSFATSIMLKRHRKENIYTIESDQTHRDWHGELPETVLEYVDRMPRLAETCAQRTHKDKISKEEEAIKNVLGFIGQHPGSTTEEIMNGLHMAKKTVMKSIEMTELVKRTGNGAKGDPFKFFCEIPGEKPKEVGRVVGYVPVLGRKT